VPAVVRKLRDLAARSDSKLDLIVSWLERDPALVLRVMQLRRSASFGRSSVQNPDLHFIINRVGFLQLSAVVETVWSNDCFRVDDPRYEPEFTRLTRLSVARAMTMRALAEHIGVEVFPAYLLGLFADVGASLLLRALCDKTRAFVIAPSESMTIVRAYHESMSTAALKMWGHAEPMLSIIRKHHAPVLTGANATYSSLLLLACQMAEQLSGDEDPTGSDEFSPELVARVSASMKIDEATRETLMARLKSEFEAVRDVFEEQPHERIVISYGG
jgi:HD-like signal output (HDOD) protein